MRLLAVPAVLVAAWFGLAVRQTVALDAAQHAGDGRARLDAAHAARALADLDRAGALNPDERVTLVRAQVVAEAGDLARARRILLGVVRSHPDDIEAWLRLALFSPAERARATAQVLRLSPPVR